MPYHELLNWTLTRAYDERHIPRPTGKDKTICNLEAACLEAMSEIEMDRPKAAHNILKAALVEAI